MPKLICMGDCVIDFLPERTGSLVYTAKMGGAPANVCACVSKLGGKSVYLGKLAEDNFGKFLLSELKKYNIDTSSVILDNNCKTGLVFVDSYDNGERDFFFYRDRPADSMLYPEEIDSNLFEKNDVLHFCSIALMESPTKHAHVQAIDYAVANGCLISFDVNVRMDLWRDKNKLITTVNEFLPLCDIVKVTDEELALITSCDDEKSAVKILFSRACRAKIVFITKGENGSSVYDRTLENFSLPARKMDVVDTTGAGDCFIGSVIHLLLAKKADLSLNKLKEAVVFATKACAIVITRKGGAPSMPSLDEIEQFGN